MIDTPAASVMPLPRSARPAPHRRCARRAIALALPLLLSACLVVPRTQEVYDEGCRIHVKQITLEAAQIGRLGGCANDGCITLLVAMGAVAVASAVVSGSIAVVGNIVYWAERQGRCQRS